MADRLSDPQIDALLVAANPREAEVLLDIKDARAQRAVERYEDVNYSEHVTAAQAQLTYLQALP